MQQRYSSVLIVVFWLATMSWLVIEKVLPPLERGDPPTVASQLDVLASDGQPVGWHVLWNGEEIGVASSQARRAAGGVTELHSHVRFWRVPLDEIAPPVLRPLLHARLHSLAADSRVEIDPLGRVSGIYSQIGSDDAPGAVVLQGTVEGQRLKLQVNPGRTGWSNPVYLSRDALVADELSPQARLAGLRVGQTWSSPVYNPLRQITDSPVEILEATVEGHEAMSYDGQTVDTLLVVFRGDAGSAFGASRAPRGRMWVDREGTVLKQEMTLSGSRLTFERMTPQEAVDGTR